jgi:dTDP-glucose 4,6-dehydratase
MSKSSFRARSQISCGAFVPKLYSEGRNVRDRLHADDHSSALLQIFGRRQNRRDIPHRRQREKDNKAVVELILTMMGQDADAYDNVSDRAGHDLRYAIDSTKLRNELGWKPRYRDFEHGLSATIEWYRNHEDWWAPAKDATEAFYARLAQ